MKTAKKLNVLMNFTVVFQNRCKMLKKSLQKNRYKKSIFFIVHGELEWLWGMREAHKTLTVWPTIVIWYDDMICIMTNDMVAYIGLLASLYVGLGLVCILCGPQGPYMCSLLYVYAIWTNARTILDMICGCIGMKPMWYGRL